MSWRSKLTPMIGASGAGQVPVPASMQVTPNITLLEPLDAGGMGSIWRAHHDGLGVDVAVKLIAPELLSHDRDKALARFRLEARSAARNRSRHVVQMLDHGISDGELPYIVMELLEGECLADRLERELLLEPRQVAMVVLQTCRALERAHELGIVHRDIKPDNIFLCNEDGEDFVKVLDFGVAKDVLALERKLTMDGTFVGTPEFLAPEHIVDGTSESSVDLWALAVVAYLCVTGELPFTGANLEAVCEAVLSAAVTPPSQIVDDISPELDAWFKKALAASTAERFATAKEFGEAFAHAVVGSSALSGPWDLDWLGANAERKTPRVDRSDSGDGSPIVPVEINGSGKVGRGAVLAAGVLLVGLGVWQATRASSNATAPRKAPGSAMARAPSPIQAPPQRPSAVASSTSTGMQAPRASASAVSRVKPPESQVAKRWAGRSAAGAGKKQPKKQLPPKRSLRPPGF